MKALQEGSPPQGDPPPIEFRGSGKSTELRRLRYKLDTGGPYKVALVDIEDYLSPSQPIDVSDFLMALAGGLGDALLESGHLMGDPAHEKLQKRMAGHLGALTGDVRAYVEECVKKVNARYGPDTEVVLLVDSMEHIRGTC